MKQMKNGQRNDYINWVLTLMIEYLAYQMVVDKSSASVDAKVEAKNLFETIWRVITSESEPTEWGKTRP